MKTQLDMEARVVALENLQAMCKRVSSMCHRFTVVKVTRSRVHVEYSNPDEYGREHPMTAVYPCFPSLGVGDEDNPRVMLDSLRVINDDWHGEGWQAFEELECCPTLWRHTEAGVETWQTHSEILEARRAAGDDRPDGHDTCTVCDLPDKR